MLVILDEIIVTIWFELVSEKDILEIIGNKPENLELILIDRYASSALI